MGRIRRYWPGQTVNNYLIVRRHETDSRILWVKCQHPGCEASHQVYLSSVLQGGARKFCDKHKAINLQTRRVEREQARHIQLSIDVAAQRAKSAPDLNPVVGTVQESVDFRSALDTSAVRVARDLIGARWNGYVLEGRAFGWYLVQSRCTTPGGAVRWLATCAVCGTGRMLYEAQLKREEQNRCPHCMGPRGRYELARSLYRRAAEMGHDMHDPLTLLHVANRLAHGFEDEGCLKWTADAYVTFRKMVDWESEQLKDQDFALPPIEEAKEEEIDWWSVPLADWPTPVLEEYLRDMQRNPKNYTFLGLRYVTMQLEMYSESQRRLKLAAESEDENA